MSPNDIEFWDELYKKNGASWQSPYSKDMHHKIKSLIPSEVVKILDAGCGGGSLMLLLKTDSRFIIEGVDQSEEGVRHINESLGMNASVGDLTKLTNYNDGTFDMVICSEVLEHVPVSSLHAVVRELCRISKKYVMLTNPYKEVLTYQHINCTHCHSRYHPSGHIHCVDKIFMNNLFKIYAAEILFYFSGTMLYNSKVFAFVLRSFGYRLFSLATKCPLCETMVIRKNWTIPVRVFGRIYVTIQKLLRFFGVKKPAKIITLIKLAK